MSIAHENALVTAASSREVYDEPLVKNPAEQRLMELIEREQLPGDMRSTLAGALTGDLARQDLLFQAMLDTWPRLQKNISEIKRAVRRAPWQIMPRKGRRDNEATLEAKKRAEFIEDLFWETTPNIAKLELSAESLLGELVYGYYTGINVIETYWARGSQIKPFAYKSVPARFYGFPPMSEDNESDRLMYNPDGGLSGQDFEDFPNHKFLLSINKGHHGHAAVAAPLRALTGYWLAANFGLKWLLNFAQLYGIPFRWAEYSDESVKGKVSAMLQSIGSAGWGAFPKGTKINFEDASKSANALPQADLIKMADTQCDIFILGQTLTSDVGDSGSRALGDVHNAVKQEMIDGVCDHVEDILNRQLVPSILVLNFDDAENAPKFEAAFIKEQNEKEMAERDNIILQSGIPVSKKWYYERHKVPAPENEEDTFTSSRPNGAQGDPATGLKFPHETKEGEELKDKEKKDKVLEGSDQDVLTVGALSDSVLEGLTNVTPEWLGLVKPFFDRLAALAMSKTVSDADFMDALEKAQGELPELFEVLDTEALQEAFSAALGSGVIAGGADRYFG